MRAIAKEEVDRIICLIDSVAVSELPCATPERSVEEQGLAPAGKDAGVDQYALIAASHDLLQCLKWMVGLYECKCKDENGLVSGPEYYASLNAIARATGGTALTLQNLSQLFPGFDRISNSDNVIDARDELLAALELLLDDYIRLTQSERLESGSGDISREEVLEVCEPARNAAAAIARVKGTDD